ncbi:MULTISPECIES: CDP-alcohol phosphatidyltransferase family protein [Methylomonas]|uniref:CDP-alcohol phosphatidyltransferase n=1 Tax=Methylomonas koyamae TaxID=702114 RepID=A0A177NIV2_9GAMM|nr:CDP-alcohol phosphatidyltransferase family protein [Methylomonas koyamae]OAI17805.1 hypothetical protein A1355_06915 [Methylomonas koyamae]
MSDSPEPILRKLNRELNRLSLFAVAGFLIGFAGLAVAGGWCAAGVWLAQAGAGLWLIRQTARRRLALNRLNPRTPLYRNLGWGNRLTLLRGALIAATGGCLFSDPTAPANPWLPALCYTLAALLDRYDGYAARRSGRVSLLGAELDLHFDALGLLIAPLLAVQWQRLPTGYLLLSLAFYLYRWLLQARVRRGLPTFPLPDNPLRRTLAGFQMGFVALTLWPVLEPAFSRQVSTAFMLPVLFGFVADWLVANGRCTARTYTQIGELADRTALPGLRIGLILALTLAGGFERTEAAGLSVALAWSASILLAVGCAGRLGALAILLLFGGGWLSVAQPALGLAILFAASWLLLLGTGRYSLSRWGEAWLQRYVGA